MVGRGRRQMAGKGALSLLSTILVPGRVGTSYLHLLQISQLPGRLLLVPPCMEARRGRAPLAVGPGVPGQPPSAPSGPRSPCPTTTPGCCSTSSPSCSSSASSCSTCSWASWWRTFTSAGSTRRPRRRGGARRSGSVAWRGSAGVRPSRWRWPVATCASPSPPST